jgi:hypothetical protein
VISDMMSDPSWLNNVFAALMLAVALYSAARVVAARSLRRATHYDIDIAHVPMGVAMAAMFAPELNFLPWWLWGIVFTALTGYFVVRTVIAAGRRTIWTDHYLPHTVHAGAMLYMVLAAPAALSTTGMASPAMTAMSSGAGSEPHLPTIALVLALFMAGYTVVLSNALPGPNAVTETREANPPLDPHGGLLYKIVMSVGMGFMLILML